MYDKTPQNIPDERINLSEVDRFETQPTQTKAISGRPREACGIVGVFMNNEAVAQTTFYGLFALQHRGQESAGISTTDGARIYTKTGMGLVASVFQTEDMEKLPGFAAIGHTRYSTMGSSKYSNAQPVIAEGPHGKIALAHNGNLINAAAMRDWLERNHGVYMRGSSDSEIIASVYAKAPGKNWEERSAFCMRRLEGAYSLLILTEEELVAVRDPIGIRPLCIGELDGGGIAFASETAALDNIGARFIREILNGETVVINKDGMRSYRWNGARKKESMCIFEHIYFARPDSVLNGQLAYSSRMRMGVNLYNEHPAEADLVIGVPDSAIAPAVGFAQASGIPFGEGLVRNRYAGRTFIEPDQRLRQVGVQIKFNAMPGIIAGKRLVVVDDSIVRGTTTPHIIKLLREAGASKIHMRISSPPVISTCHFGVDMAARRDLIAANLSIEELREKIGADSLGYLSVGGLRDAVKVNDDTSGSCNGCFTGKYPIHVQLDMDKLELEAAVNQKI